MFILLKNVKFLKYPWIPKQIIFINSAVADSSMVDVQPIVDENHEIATPRSKPADAEEEKKQQDQIEARRGKPC